MAEFRTVVAVDPAERNTGIVVMRTGLDGSWEFYSSCTLPAWRVKTFLTLLQQQFPPAIVIAERQPRQQYVDASALDLLNWLGWKFGSAVVEVGPAQWKGWASHQREKTRLPKGLATQHERDAYRMFQWWCAEKDKGAEGEGFGS